MEIRRCGGHQVSAALLGRHLRQHLDVLVCMSQLVLQARDLLTQLVDKLDLRVDVLSRLIRNERRFHGVVQRREILLNILV